MSYSVNPASFKSIFAVPTDIVDKHIRLATEHQLKVLLWILRTSPDNPDIDAMCSALKISKDDAEDYLQYWILTGVLVSDGKAETAAPKASTVEQSKNSVPDNKVEAVTEAPAKTEVSVVPSKPSSSEIATRIDESPEIGYLFNEAQTKLGKTIGYDGQCTLLLLHDHYGLPTEVLFMLIEYCVSVGKTNYGYIEAVGRDWGNREVDTLEKAAEQIAALKSANNIWRELALNAGLNNPRPTVKQSEYLRKWSSSMKFSTEMIILAYEEMAEHTGKLNFKYIDRILTSWQNAGYRSPADVEAGKVNTSTASQPVKSKNSEPQNGRNASYNLDEFENRSLHGSLVYNKRKKKQ